MSAGSDRASNEVQRDDLNALPSIPAAAVKTPAEFAAVVEAGAPFVLKGIIEDWPALELGRKSPSALNAYLKALDCGLPGPVMEAPSSSNGRFAYSADLREFTFSKRQLGICETLDRIERQLDRPNAPIVAIQMLALARHMPGFVPQNPMPLLPEAAPLLWLGGRVRTQIHNDRDHNLACVVAGRRRFVLFPPEQVRNLYIGPLDNPPPLSLVDPEAPDLARFPRFAKALAAAQLAELAPGDALFLPRCWWHYVVSLDRYNVMVNYWWNDRPPGVEASYDAFLAALLALKDLSPGERAYWKAMFDAFVFRLDGDAVEHIPEALRGPLGELGPALRAALRRRVSAAFSGNLS